MIPLSDDNPTRTFPVLTLTLIGANVLIFFYGFSLPISPPELFAEYGLVPSLLVHSPVTAYSTLFSSMFLHSGLAHLGGNMLYLWIFGNNIEDVLGKFRFILFYFTCGALAALSHIATDYNSQIPMVGASGAISGILGAYMILFPHAKVKTLVFLGFFITIIRIPALILLAIWMLLQVGSGLMAGGAGSSVAIFAHIGGFLAGMILITPFRRMG